ncbi:MAG: CDP-alcohol phosphatidyltransferase family protein [Ignavibacteriae bacterium]|nr:CDP-alcohol phosphatidyltransferase family protein [Ignavibacteriota bacterium]
MGSQTDGVLSGLIRVSHEKLGLTPNQISTVGFLVGMIAALLFAAGFVVTGLMSLAVSQIIDGLDGGVARRYNLRSQKGEKLEIIYDRLNELAILLALAYAGHSSFLIAILAFVAIVLVTVVHPLSHFDPGFKRFMIYLGYVATALFNVRGFDLAIHVIFFANLTTFVIGTIMVDYRLQRDIDMQAMLRREAERKMGFAQPEDPPSLLTYLFRLFS